MDDSNGPSQILLKIKIKGGGFEGKEGKVGFWHAEWEGLADIENPTSKVS